MIKKILTPFSAVLLLVFTLISATQAEEFEKSGDCSHLLVDSRKSAPVPCANTSVPRCAFEHASVISRDVKRCDRQAILGANMAALAFRMGDERDALRLALNAVGKVASVPDQHTAAMAMWQVANFLGYGGLEAMVRDLSERMPPPMGAGNLAALAQRKANQCDMKEAARIMDEAETIFDAGKDKATYLRLQVHVRMAISYFLVRQFDDATRHASAAKTTDMVLVSEFGTEKHRFHAVKALAGAGQFEEAEAVVEKTEAPGPRTVAYAVLADGLTFFSRGADALETIDAAEKALTEVDDRRIREQARMALGPARARAGLDTRAEDLSDPFYKAHTYGRVGHALMDLQEDLRPGRCR